MTGSVIRTLAIGIGWIEVAAGVRLRGRKVQVASIQYPGRVTP